MAEPKVAKRGGKRPGAGQPRKQPGYRRVNISPSLDALEQLQRIHPKLTTAIEIAAQFYEDHHAAR